MISVIVPVYKVEKYIQNCVSSILSQSYRDFEIIVVNDGTPDRSAELARELLEGQDEIPYQIISTENRGVSAARNTGLKNALGEYAVMVDADDVIAPSFLQDYISMQEAYPNGDIYSFGFTVVSENDEIRFSEDKADYMVFSYEEAQKHFFERSIRFLLPTLLLRTEFLRQNGILFDEKVRYSEDVQFIWRCLAYNRNRVIHSKKEIYRYILHGGSTMTASGIEKILTLCDGLNRLMEECGTLFCEPIGEELVGRTYVSMLHGVSRMLSYSDFVSLYQRAGCQPYIKQQLRHGRFIPRMIALILLCSKRVGYYVMKKF